mgnify:FL=1
MQKPRTRLRDAFDNLLEREVNRLGARAALAEALADASGASGAKLTKHKYAEVREGN